jgi:predicted nucleotidyltransferase
MDRVPAFAAAKTLPIRICKMCGDVWYIVPMNKEDIIARLRENEAALRARGVAHAALFGSRARRDNRPDSDIDIMIETESGVLQDVYSYVALKSYIAELFEEPVDVVDHDFLKPLVRPPAEDDAVYAF